MRTMTIAEAEQNFTAVVAAAGTEPVRISEGGNDVVLISAAEFEEAQELLRKKRALALIESMRRISEEARANGFTEDMLPEDVYKRQMHAVPALSRLQDAWRTQNRKACRDAEPRNRSCALHEQKARSAAGAAARSRHRDARHVGAADVYKRQVLDTQIFLSRGKVAAD